MERKHFGTLPNGQAAELYTLATPYAQVDVSPFGATLVAVRLPDRNGVWEDVALGFDTAAEYLERGGCHGATIGRYAGRIANGRFVLNGKTVQVAQNRGDHMIHGGRIALLGLLKSDTRIDWSKVIFTGLIIKGIYGRQMHETWYKMSAMLQGGLDISGIITHRMDIRDYEKGFEAMNSGKCGKVILDWTSL